ncbi:universal stress protein [Campylobacter sp. FMV-PI01]|uniref:Universal stress protein n=1 Tax=Campylobacter portucalensis TaxID=2608384 RepID=A0A6L5WHR6_9BACT|nr:universal stress protein [Campylobacter portucalensis]MSN96584.1 universal stress protein [Campylobacter portucalensis]
MKSIVICVDHNPLNESVCKYGLNMAKNLGLKVTFLHVINTPLTAPHFLGLAAGGLVVSESSAVVYELENTKPDDEDVKNAEIILKDCLKFADEFEVEATTDLKCGDIVNILINYENAYAFIVTTKEESQEVQNNITALIRETKTPILFVNKEFSQINSVLIAFDGGNSAVNALNFLKDNEIFGQNLEYHVINVNKDCKKSEDILNQAREILHKKNAKFISLNGEVADELINYRRSNNLDLYIMGGFSKGIFATLFFGSTSKNVVQNALVPVFIVT